MDGTLSYYFRQNAMDAIFLNDLYTWGAVYLALSYTIPDASATAAYLSEPNDSVYQRISIPLTNSYWSDDGTGIITMIQSVTYSVASVDWGQPLGWALCTDVQTGPLIASGTLGNMPYIAAGSQVYIPASTVILGLDG